MIPNDYQGGGIVIKTVLILIIREPKSMPNDYQGGGKPRPYPVRFRSRLRSRVGAGLALSLVGFLEKEENSPPPIAQKGKKSVETDFCCYDRKKSRSVVRRKNHVSPSAIIAVDGNRVNGL
jgi:hypothetical protein